MPIEAHKLSRLFKSETSSLAFHRVLVYGAGVLGSLYSARLRQAGHDVILLARGHRLADLR